MQPSYQLTNKLLANITQSERLYGQIESLRIPKKLEINLTRDNLVQSSYASNRIEGNPLSKGEVTNLLLDDRVPANRDEKEVVNYFELLRKLDSFKTEEISLPFIVNIHRELMTGVDKSAGVIRNVPVVVGRFKEDRDGDVSLRVKHNPPFHKRTQIEMALSEQLNQLKNQNELPILVKTGLFHHQFVYIHPFEDGNGRVCRLLTALLFIQSGYEINKYFILDDYYDIDRQEYSDMLHSADNGDKSQWLEYFSDGVKYSLQSAYARVKNAVKTLAFQDQPTPKEKEVLIYLTEHPEITSTDIAGKLKVSRQQAHALLKSLVEKGLVMKKGITKRSFYALK